jgi:cysteine sulfinate desulfinase/cysteine desulfurase-like protein
MGIDAAIARGAIRASLGNSTTEAEVDRFVQTWNTVAGSLFKERSGVAA